MEKIIVKKKAWWVLLCLVLCLVALVAFNGGCASQSSRRIPLVAQQEPQGSGCDEAEKSYQGPGPKVFERGYYHDTKYDSKFDHLVKNTWKISPDGNSGSMSQTSVRTYENTTKGEYGTTIGPAGFGRGGY